MNTHPHRKTLVAVLILLLLSISMLPAQEAPAEEEDPASALYGLGDRTLTITGGLIIPLFFQSLSGDVEGTNLSLGGVGSLQISSYLNSNMTLGAELGGMFAFSPNGRTLLMLPVTAKYSYIFRNYPFEFPVSIGAGLNMVKLDDNFHIDPILKPGASVFWNYNSEWAFGLNMTYWWVPQIYTGGGSIPHSHSRFGNFLEVSLSALYHF